MTAADFAKLVRGSRRRADGEWWDARCPAHHDQHASLSFADGDHALIVHCQAGCSREAIAEGAPVLIARAEDREAVADAIAEILIAQLGAEGGA